jgi:hypothetical protein
MSTLEQRTAETLERVIRMESRLVQLGDHVGANLRTKQRIVITRDIDGVHVGIDSLDVSISRILSELQRDGVPARGEVDVWHDNRRVITLYL